MTLRPSIHWLLIAMPVAAALDAMGVAAPIVFLCAALAIVPAGQPDRAQHRAPRGAHGPGPRRAPQRDVRQPAGAHHRDGGAARRAGRDGQGLADRRPARQPAARPRPRLPPGGPASPRAGVQPGRGAHLRLHDAPGGRQHGGAEHVPPLPGRRRAAARRRARHRRGGRAPGRLRALPGLHAPHPPGGLRRRSRRSRGDARRRVERSRGRRAPSWRPRSERRG